MRVQAHGPGGGLLREGELVASLSPLASFLALDARVGLAQRRISLAQGRARLTLPPGVPVALAIQGPRLRAWTGPFFAGQVVTLTAQEPALLSVDLALPPGSKTLPAWLYLRTPPLPGTGAAHQVETSGVAPGPVTLPPFAPGPVELVVLVQDLAPQVLRLDLEPGPNSLPVLLARGATLELSAEDPEGGAPLGPGGTLALDGLRLPWARLSDRGTCRISGIPAGKTAHRIDLFLPGREPLSHWWAPQAANATSRITLRPRPSLLLQATLRDPAGHPAADVQVVGAGVRLTAMGREPFSIPGQTDASGTLRLFLPPTGLPGVLILLGEGGPQGTLLLPPLEGPGPLDLGILDLPAHPPLQGRLLDLSLTEAAGAWVDLLPAEGSPIDPLLLHRRVPVAPDGSFTFLGAPGGPHLLRATAPGRVGRERALRLGAARESLELDLPKGLSLSGQVLFPGDRPAPGALVRIQPLCQDFLPVLASTDPEGRFHASGVPVARVRVSAVLEHAGASWSGSVLLENRAGEEVRMTLFQEP